MSGVVDTAAALFPANTSGILLLFYLSPVPVLSCNTKITPLQFPDPACKCVTGRDTFTGGRRAELMLA